MTSLDSERSKHIQSSKIIETDKELISFGKLYPIDLICKVNAKVKKISYNLSIKGECKSSEIFLDRIPEFFICCRKTRYNRIVKPTESIDNIYYYETSIPLNLIYKQVECKFVICNEKYDIIQQSKKIEIRIEEEWEEDFPPIKWVDFRDYHPCIQNLYWFIKSDLDNPIKIHFNETKMHFKEAIHLKIKSKFRDDFIRHFSQVYSASLFFDIEKLSEESLEEYIDPDNPYHERVASLLSRKEFHEDILWYKFAFLLQELTDIRKEYDEMLMREMEEDK